MTQAKRGPGRPRKQPEEDVVQEATPTVLVDRKGRKFSPKYHEADSQGKAVLKDGELVLKKKSTRAPIGPNLTLDATEYQKQNPGMKLLWFNDRNGKIDKMKAAQWEPVQGKDGPVRRHVGKSFDNEGGMNAHLMMIPDEWFEEDKAAKQAMILDADPQGVGSDEYTVDKTGKRIVGQGDALRDESPLA